MTLYQKYGGNEGVGHIVRDFYDKVISDSTLGHYFSKTSMSTLISHQIEFISVALGKPSEYSGLDMRTAHRGYRIKNESFLRVKSLFVDTLAEHKFEQNDIKEIGLIIDSLKSDIVSS